MFNASMSGSNIMIKNGDTREIIASITSQKSGVPHQSRFLGVQ